MTQAVKLAQLGSPGISTGFKNRIINGAMVIDQRNAGASGTFTGGTYSLDRWKCSASQASKGTFQQNAGSVTPPAGFTKYYGFTSTSAYSVVSTDYFSLVQNIEGYNVADLNWGTANAKTVTLSFYVYSSLTGTFGGCLQNQAATRSYPFSYTVSSANTWTLISITIAGDTTGTWVTDNGIGICLRFSLGMGSNASGTAGAWVGSDIESVTGAVSVVGTNGATFYITGVQLEVGTTATDFEYRPYGTELNLCYRYFYRVGYDSIAYEHYGNGYWQSSTRVVAQIQYNQPMRSQPTATYGTVGSFYVSNQATNIACSALTTDVNGLTVLAIAADVSSGGNSGGGSRIFRNASQSNSYITLSAEL